MGEGVGEVVGCRFALPGTFHTQRVDRREHRTEGWIFAGQSWGVLRQRLDGEASVGATCLRPYERRRAADELCIERRRVGSGGEPARLLVPSARRHDVLHGVPQELERARPIDAIAHNQPSRPEAVEAAGDVAAREVERFGQRAHRDLGARDELRENEDVASLEHAHKVSQHSGRCKECE